jgi:hypothetical protein
MHMFSGFGKLILSAKFNGIFLEPARVNKPNLLSVPKLTIGWGALSPVRTAALLIQAPHIVFAWNVEVSKLPHEPGYSVYHAHPSP